jgi:hypothetical protein
MKAQFPMAFLPPAVSIALASLVIPKSSPKRIATKKARESLPPGLSFSTRLLKIHALTAKEDHNLLI